MDTQTIDGVVVMPLKRIPDVRGTIMHGVRRDTALSPIGEVYFKKLYPDIINGWHVHKALELNYLCVFGMVRLVLCDMRRKSPTYKKIQEICFGDDNYVLVHVPPGVANASESLRPPFAIICNVASEPHDPKVKYTRIDPRSKKIPFDWNRRNF